VTYTTRSSMDVLML